MSEASTSGESVVRSSSSSRKRKSPPPVSVERIVYDTKSDCVQAQCLSVLFKDKKVKISDDRLTASSPGGVGYVTALATCSAIEGAWYFEIKIEELDGHVRIGWSTRRTPYDVPIGADCFSYSIRDSDSARVVQACKSVYGDRKLIVGDIVGCWLRLPVSPTSPRETVTSDAIPSLHPNLLCDPENPPIEEIFQLAESGIGFAVNGVDLGTAFTGLVAGGEFHPAVSLYGKSKVSFNFGPNFSHPQEMLRPASDMFVRKDLLKPKRRPLNFIPKAMQRINS